MAEYERRPASLLHASDELRALIQKHPELPLMILAGESSNDGEFGYTICERVHAEVGEYLDCYQGFGEDRVYTDRKELEEDLADLIDYEPGRSDAEFDALLKARLEEFAPYWRPCILLYANN